MFLRHGDGWCWWLVDVSKGYVMKVNLGLGPVDNITAEIQSVSCELVAQAGMVGQSSRLSSL